MANKIEWITIIAAFLTAVAAFCSIMDYTAQPSAETTDVVNDPVVMNVRFVFTENNRVYAIDHDKNLVMGNSSIIFRVA